MQQFTDKLKKYLTYKREDLYTEVETVNSFGYTVSRNDFKFDEMLDAIDEFSKQFKGE